MTDGKQYAICTPSGTKLVTRDEFLRSMLRKPHLVTQMLLAEFIRRNPVEDRPA